MGLHRANRLKHRQAIGKSRTDTCYRTCDFKHLGPSNGPQPLVRGPSVAHVFSLNTASVLGVQPYVLGVRAPVDRQYRSCGHGLRTDITLGPTQP